MKYPWTRNTRRKNIQSNDTKKDQRGTTWIVDLSSQYWIVRLTKRKRQGKVDKCEMFTIQGNGNLRVQTNNRQFMSKLQVCGDTPASRYPWNKQQCSLVNCLLLTRYECDRSMVDSFILPVRPSPPIEVQILLTLRTLLLEWRSPEGVVIYSFHHYLSTIFGTPDVISKLLLS